MGADRARLCFTRCVSGDERARIAAVLRAAGHVPVDADDGDPETPSVVVFASNAGDAIGEVRAQAALVHDRVLAVALGGDGGAALALIAAGAADVLVDGAGVAVGERVVARLDRWAAIDGLLASEAVRGTLIGASAAWHRVLRQIVEVARFTDAPILITGETGTGKELVSRLIHALDARRPKRDFVVLDCTTIVPELSGSEFFGHEKGSFTGALAARNGAFALADGGTLFLDEVGELSLLLQAELLRVVQERSYKRIGGSVWQSTQFRLVCATNRELVREQDEGRFRADLYYRISGWAFELPPLRDRRDDIPLLVQHFVGDALGVERPVDIDDTVMAHLMRRELRGNIRELRQICTRIAHRHVGRGAITVGDLGADLRVATAAPAVLELPEPAAVLDATSPAWCDPSFRRSIGKAIEMGVGLKEIGRLAEDVAVQLAVRSENGSLQHAARRLGVTDRALQLRRASSRQTEPPTRANGANGKPG
jgi:transcriptional regulator with GAF, ATPase, and Fis domain